MTKSTSSSWRWNKKKLLSWGDTLVSLRSWRLQDSKNGGH
jgi:hypothetical protein